MLNNVASTQRGTDTIQTYLFCFKLQNVKFNDDAARYSVVIKRVVKIFESASHTMISRGNVTA
jgi:hypothetical protein